MQETSEFHTNKNLLLATCFKSISLVIKCHEVGIKVSR